MDIKKWMNCSQSFTFTRDKQKTHIRDDKVKLKALLMRDIKTDDKGKSLLTKDDEWVKETEWDEIYSEDKKNVYVKANKDKVIHAINRCNKKYANTMKNLEK